MTSRRPVRVVPVVRESDESGWAFDSTPRNGYYSGQNASRYEKIPSVSVKRRSDGKYVIIEKYPKKLKPVSKLDSQTLRHVTYPSAITYRSIKPDWKYSPRYKVIGDHENNSLLPPIDLGWSSEAKIGSWDNYEHTPRGGEKRIPQYKLNWQAKSKIGSLDNIDHSPRRSHSDPTSEQTLQKRSYKLRVRPRYGAVGDYGAFGNKHYTPGGAEVFRPTQSYSHISPKVGSLDYIDHEPQGGDVIIPSYSTKWKSDSKIGSLDNIHHKPGGGDVIFLQERLDWRAKPKVGSLDNIDHTPGGGRKRIPNYKLNWRAEAKVGSLDNIDHIPRGGMVDVPNHPLRWKSKAKVDNKPPKRRDVGLNVSFDSLDSYEY